MKHSITLFLTSFCLTLFLVLSIGMKYAVRPLSHLKKNSSIEMAEDSSQDMYLSENQPTLSIPTDSIEISLNNFGLELPINGATGFTSIELSLYEDVTCKNLIKKLSPGTPFKILEEKENLWYVDVDGIRGFLDNRYCMINLPDVVPSIIYYNSNSESSLFRSVRKNIDGITNNQLYDATDFNNRFGETQYIMPVLYSMARKIAHTQKDALKDGNSLMIYETFRPYSVQQEVSNALSNLMNKDQEVMNMVECKPWEKNWFISTGISNHQKGAAMDVSLVNVTSAKHEYCGEYSYLKILDYEEYTMPTQMHELSILACTFTTTVSSSSKTAWKNAKLSDTMNESAIKLQSYCTNNNLYPLASEWWHFNDLDTLKAIGNKSGKGEFTVNKLVSEIPE